MKRQPSMLSKDLADHYSRHGVEGLEEYLSYGGAARFVRLNPRFDREETLALLEKELPGDCIPLPIPWLDSRLDFFAVPGDFPLGRSESYRCGRVYGMDVSSGAAVAALLYDTHDVKAPKSSKPSHEVDGPSLDRPPAKMCSSEEQAEILRKDDSIAPQALRVLDLCCSPGLKLCAIADLLPPDSSSAVVGVDIAEPRLAVCSKIIKKYHIDPLTSGDHQTPPSPASCVNVRLYCADGTTFGTLPLNEQLVFDSKAAAEDYVARGKRKRMNKSARAREKKRLRQLAHLDMEGGPLQTRGSPGSEVSTLHAAKLDENSVGQSSLLIQRFDHVLVDAECSTDGALRHIQSRYRNEQWRGSSGEEMDCGQRLMHSVATNPKLTDGTESSRLVNLQRRLIASGFRALKVGGSLVYSTCSLAAEQNEGVVSWLLEKNNPDAFIIPVSFEGSSNPEGRSSMISGGSIDGTVRFHPSIVAASTNSRVDFSSDACNNFFGGGFFLAKIGKRASAS